MSGGPRLDASRVDVLPANLEGDARQGPSRRARRWSSGLKIEEAVMTRAVQDALLRLGNDGARQVRALLTVGHQVALRQSNQHAVVQLARILEHQRRTRRNLAQACNTPYLRQSSPLAK